MQFSGHFKGKTPYCEQILVSGLRLGSKLHCCPQGPPLALFCWFPCAKNPPKSLCFSENSPQVSTRIHLWPFESAIAWKKNPILNKRNQTKNTLQWFEYKMPSKILWKLANCKLAGRFIHHRSLHDFLLDFKFTRNLDFFVGIKRDSDVPKNTLEWFVYAYCELRSINKATWPQAKSIAVWLLSGFTAFVVGVQAVWGAL